MLLGPAATSDQAANLRDTSTRPESPISGAPATRPTGQYEHNRRLDAPSRAMQEYRKAARTVTAATGWDVCRGTALSARWSVKAASDTPQAQAYAEHVRANLGIGRRSSQMGISWDAFLRQLLASRLYGYGLWELICVQGQDGSWYTRPLYIDQATVSQWIVDDWRALVAVQQSAVWSSSSSWAPLPISRLLYLGWDVEGTAFEGLGLLRLVEPLTRDQTATLQALAAAVVRGANGTPDVVLDKELWRRLNPQADESKDWAKEVETWRKLLKSYSGFEVSYFVREAWAALGSYDGGGLDGAAFNAVLQLYNLLILLPFGAQHLVLGSAGTGGSRAVGQVHADAQMQQAGAICEGIRGGLNQDLIPRCIRWQFGQDAADDDLPTVEYSGLRAPLWTEHLDKLPTLTQAGWLSPTDARGQELATGMGFETEEPPRSVRDRLQGTAARPPAESPPGPTVIRGVP